MRPTRRPTTWLHCFPCGRRPTTDDARLPGNLFSTDKLNAIISAGDLAASGGDLMENTANDTSLVQAFPSARLCCLSTEQARA